LVSDWVCFSLAPIQHIATLAYDGLSMSLCVAVFLIANVITSPFQPYMMDRFGFRNTLILGSVLMCFGCVVRSGFFRGDEGATTLMLMVGTAIVGTGHPFFQCCCSTLSANWFPAQERTLATTVGLNSNQVGIACAYLFGSWFIDNSTDVYRYFKIMAVVSGVLMVGVILQFRQTPPTPPTRSSKMRAGVDTDAHNRPYFDLACIYFLSWCPLLDRLPLVTQ
jgi:MFS family permease